MTSSCMISVSVPCCVVVRACVCVCVSRALAVPAPRDHQIYARARTSISPMFGRVRPRSPCTNSFTYVPAEAAA